MNIIVYIDGVPFKLVPAVTEEAPLKRQTSIDDCELRTRTRNALRADGFLYLEQALEMSEAQLLRIPLLGRRGLQDIKEAVSCRWPNSHVGQYQKPDL